MDAVTTEGQVTFENLREICHVKVCFEERAGVGTHVEFDDELFDADGSKVGTSHGLSVIFSSASGSMMQLFSGTDEFEDGTVIWTGACPSEPSDIAKEHSVVAVGGSGRLLGKVGTRRFRFLEKPSEDLTIIQTSIYLHD
jgi:hypothetical protein